MILNERLDVTVETNNMEDFNRILNIILSDINYSWIYSKFNG